VAQPDELGLQAAVAVGFGEAGDPFRRGGEQDPVPALAGADREPGSQVGLAGSAGRGDDVLPADDEVQGAEAGDQVALEAAGVVEVELLRLLRAGNRAARIRPSPPWDSRAETSRCRQATRDSSCDQE